MSEEFCRVITLSHTPPSFSPYPNNKIACSRYTWADLFPKSLYTQFQNPFLIYFLALSILELYPTENIRLEYSTIIPLAILVLFGLTEDIIYNVSTKRQDQELNSNGYSVWNGKEFSMQRCDSILVGNLVKVYDLQMAPADILVICSDNNDASFFADCTEILGNVNMKAGHAVFDTQALLHQDYCEGILENFSGKIKVSEPNGDLGAFFGKLYLEKYPNSIELEKGNILLRSASLHGVNFVIGVVIYAGIDTRIYSGIRLDSRKKPSLTRVLSLLLLFLLMLYVFLISHSVKFSKSDFTVFERIQFFAYEHSNVIPITLFIYLYIIRWLQALAIRLRMKRKCRFNNICTNEALGQVEYIVTSLSGVVTESIFQVELLMIGLVTYFCNEAEMRSKTEPDEFPINLQFNQLGLSLNDLKKKMESPEIKEFFLALLLSNLITPSGNSNNFCGASKEESVIIDICKDFGVVLISKNSHTIIIEYSEKLVTFNVVAFSQGKNMRILIQKNSGKWTLFVRGNEENMLRGLKFEDLIKDEILEKIKYFKEKGIRIFILATMDYEEEVLEKLSNKIKNAKSFPIKSEQRIENIFRKLEKDLNYLGICGIVDLVHSDTNLAISQLFNAGIKIWTTSGEGKFSSVASCRKSGIIQGEVPVVSLSHGKTYSSCLKQLRKAISEYVLFEEIPESSEVLTILEQRNSKIFDKSPGIDASDILCTSLNNYSKMHEETRLTTQISIIEDSMGKFLLRPFNCHSLNFAVAIDRITWKTAKSQKTTLQLLTCLLFTAKTVCFYKFLSSDKAEIVKLLRNNLKFSPTVLAVGDGEPDIPMLQVSNIGIIIEKSQNQFVTSLSDIKIQHFSLIRDLLLFHGFWNLSRITRVILLFLYKNLMLITVSFFYLNFRDENVIDLEFCVWYNVALTSITLVTLGVEDQNYSEEQIMSRESFYYFGISTNTINPVSAGIYLLSGISNGVIISGLVNIALSESIITPKGLTEDFQILGACLFIIVSCTALLEIIIRTHYFSNAFIGTNALSAVLILLIVIVKATQLNSSIDGVVEKILSSPLVLILIFTIPLVCVITNTLVFTIGFFIFKKKPIAQIEKYSGTLGSVFKKSTVSEKSANDVYDMNKYTMRFHSAFMEKMYQENYITSSIKNSRIMICIFCGLLICCILTVAILYPSMPFLIFLIAAAFSFAVIIGLSLTSLLHRYYQRFILLIIVLTIICKFITEAYLKQPSLLLTAMIPSITFIFFNVDWVKITFLNILNILFYIITRARRDDSFELSDFIHSLSILLSIIITSAFLARTLERTRRQEFKLLQLQEITYDKTQRILGFLLPNFVKKRVKDGVRYIAEDQGTVTIVFCDIVDFDIICAEYSPTELTFFLHLFFQKLDLLCSTYGVTKIETVGKTYMACAGLRDSESELENSLGFISHAKRCLNLAFGIIEETHKFSMKNEMKLEVKIGIHSGPVTAGVVGYHKPQFSLVGDTVNTASRMCSTLEDGNSIQISLETYAMIPDVSTIKFRPNKVFAKGKGILKTFTYSTKSSGDFWNFLEEISVFRANSMLCSVANTEKTDSRLGTKDRGFMGFLDESFRSDTVFLSNTSWYSCNYSENSKQYRFRMDKLENNRDIMQLGIIVSLLNFTVILILSLINRSNNSENLMYSNLALRISSFILLLITAIAYKYVYTRRWFPLVYLIVLINILSASLTEQPKDHRIMALEIMYIILLLNHTSGFSFKGITWFTPAILFPYLIFISVPSPILLNLDGALFAVIFTFVNSSAVFSRESQLRNYFNLKALTEKDVAKTEKLLVQMMPPHALESLKNNKPITDRLFGVTLLYADIVGFTSWSSNKSPNQVVDMLSRLFTRFDKLCVVHKVYKVHTIGDCYVVMGYLESKVRNPVEECFNVTNMALSMIATIDRINLEVGSDLQMRIGLHTGEVIAGVIGTNIVRYDIYGPDVLVANKMESCGEAGKINVSEATKNMVSGKGNYQFVYNKEIIFKTIKTAYSSYFLSTCDFA